MEFIIIKKARTDILQKMLPYADGIFRQRIEDELRNRNDAQPLDENCTPHKFMTNDIYY